MVKNELGFGLLESILLIFAIFAIMVVGLYVGIKYNSKQNAIKQQKIIASKSLNAQIKTSRTVNGVMDGLISAGLTESALPTISKEDYCNYNVYDGGDNISFGHSTICTYQEDAYLFFKNSFTSSATNVASYLQSKNYIRKSEGYIIPEMLSDACVYSDGDVKPSITFSMFSLTSFTNTDANNISCLWVLPRSQIKEQTMAIALERLTQ